MRSTIIFIAGVLMGGVFGFLVGWIARADLRGSLLSLFKKGGRR